MTGKIGRMKGLAQIPLMIGLLIMAIAVPAATKLVQQSQDKRSSADVGSGGGGALGDVCATDGNCQRQLWCYNDVCSAKGCSSDSECSNNGGVCYNSVCVPSDSRDYGESCLVNEACSSRICKGGKCSANDVGGRHGSCEFDEYICPIGSALYKKCLNGTTEFDRTCKCEIGGNSCDIPGGDNPLNVDTCTPGGYYCTGIDNSDPFGMEVSSLKCPDGQKCFNCKPASPGVCAYVGQRVATGQSRINADGSGCAKICTAADIPTDPPVVPTNPPVVPTTPPTTYTCASNGGYCTGSDNKQIGIYIERMNGTCAGGASEACVKCKANNNQCVLDPQSNTYRMTTGAQITSAGAGCYKSCTPAVTYTCASNGGYCTGSDNKQIGIYIERMNGTCAGGATETCVKCMADNNKCVLDPQSNTYRMTTGAQISSAGAGCYKSCTPAVTGTCEANKGYCTASGNSQIGIYIEKIDGTCAGGATETCVKCMADNKKCVFDPQTKAYQMTTGAQISSAGAGCYTSCTPSANCNCPEGTTMAGQAKASGDANCDGKVTLIDFAIWADEFTSRATTTKSNFGCVSGRTVVDMSDFELWRTNFKGDL